MVDFVDNTCMDALQTLENKFILMHVCYIYICDVVGCSHNEENTKNLVLTSFVLPYQKTFYIYGHNNYFPL